MRLFVTPGAFPYVPESEREKEEGERVVFSLRIMPARTMARVQNDASDILGMGVRKGALILGLLRYGIAGVEGPDVPAFTLDEENDVEAASDEFLDSLSGDVKIELSNVIDEWNTVGREKGKASGS